MDSRFTLCQDTMANHQDYVELGRSCVDVCQVLNRGLNGKRLDKLPQSVLDAIEQFTRCVTPEMRALSASHTEVSIAGPWL